MIKLERRREYLASPDREIQIDAHPRAIAAAPACPPDQLEVVKKTAIDGKSPPHGGGTGLRGAPALNDEARRAEKFLSAKHYNLTKAMRRAGFAIPSTGPIFYRYRFRSCVMHTSPSIAAV